MDTDETKSGPVVVIGPYVPLTQAELDAYYIQYRRAILTYTRNPEQAS